MITAFGKHVRKARIDLGMHQKDMAAELGVSAAYLSSLETGRKTITTKVISNVSTFLGYQPGSAEHNNLRDAAQLSNGIVTIDIRDTSPLHRRVAIKLAMQFSSLTDRDLGKILGILSIRSALSQSR